MSIQSVFDALAKRARRQQEVEAGLQRNSPTLRAAVERQLARFRGSDATPASIADEAVAFALWGKELQSHFLDYQQAVGGLARAVEVVLAATFYERRFFEWDSREWGLRRAAAPQALSSQGLDLWAELKLRAKKAKGAELKAALAVLDGATSRALLVRSAFAFVFPQHKTLWSAADDAAIREYDCDDGHGAPFGVLSCLRETSLEPDDDSLPEASAIRRALRDESVSALRLMRDWEELAALGTVDALRVLAEFADRGVFRDLEPSRVLEPLATVLTTHRPRRRDGLRFALGFLQRATLRAPKLAQKSKLAIVQECLAQSGALLPPADWTSPWATPVKKAGPVSPPSAAKALPTREVFHWTAEERETVDKVDEDLTAASSKARRREVEREAKSSRALLWMMTGMNDADALDAWDRVPVRKWYGKVDDLQHVLMRFGARALDQAIALVTLKPDRLAALSGVDSPRVAPLMARGFVKVKKVRDVGDAWLRRFPRTAAVGLLPDLISSERERREVAASALERLREHSAASVDEVAREMGAEWAAFVASSVAQTKRLPRKPTLPGFLDVPTLPRPMKDGRALQGEGLQELVCLFKLGRASDGGFERESLTRLVWELFSRWVYAGAPPKEKWCMQALSFFPSDDAAEALGPLAKYWAPRGSPTRAQDAVEVLAKMQSVAALAQLMMLSKVQSKALRAKAAKVFAEEAARMELTPEDLADRLIPDFGPMVRSTDSGQVKVRLDVKLKPTLVDEAGAPISLPKKVDDETREWWATFESDAPTVGRAQARRLERAMVESKPMSLEHFTETYVLHPVLSALAQGVLWGEYEQGQLVRALALDGFSLVDAARKKVVPSRSIGVVHPAELDERSLEAWRERLPTQPFAQLSRPVRRTTQSALLKQGRALVGVEVDTERLVRLSRAGWRQGPAWQGGCYNSLERSDAGAKVVLSFSPGIDLVDWKTNARQTIEEFLVEGTASAALRSETAVGLLELVAAR